MRVQGQGVCSNFEVEPWILDLFVQIPYVPDSAQKHSEHLKTPVVFNVVSKKDHLLAKEALRGSGSRLHQESISSKLKETTLLLLLLFLGIIRDIARHPPKWISQLHGVVVDLM